MPSLRRLIGLASCAGTLLAATACGPKAVSHVDERAVEESLIRSADQSCQRAAQSRTAERVINCYTQNALWIIPHMPPAKGHDAILTAWRDLFLQSSFALTWRTTEIIAAHSGEIGYSLCTYRLTARFKNSKQPITDQGDGLAVWKRQPDGKWKMAADVLSSNPPASNASTR